MFWLNDLFLVLKKYTFKENKMVYENSMKNKKVCRTHERCAMACFFLKRHTWPRKGTWPICSTMHAIARSVSISLRRKWSNSDSPENDNLKKVFNKRSWCGKTIRSVPHETHSARQLLDVNESLKKNILVFYCFTLPSKLTMILESSSHLKTKSVRCAKLNLFLHFQKNYI